MQNHAIRFLNTSLNAFAKRLWQITATSLIALCIYLPSIQAGTMPENAKVILDEDGDRIRAEFNIMVNNIGTPYDIASAFVLPGQEVRIAITFTRRQAPISLKDLSTGASTPFEQQTVWTAPDAPGLYPLSIENESHKVLLNVFVKTPREKAVKGKIGFYRIGEYPKPKEIKNKTLYVVPDGYIEVTEQNKDTRLSPSFTLGEFTSKQSTKFPKYVYLRETLLLKLELIKQELNLQGIKAERMVVMSGYRTPFYNRNIGNVKFSRHVFGDAADIFVDNDSDYYMDDLNKDGKRNIKDARLLANIIEELEKREAYKPFIGGLGIYGKKPHRGPFVHVDTRGYKARWTKP